MNHLGDTNKMVSETPRMGASAYDDGAIWETGCDIERELNAANVEIEEKRKDVVYLATEKAKLEERIKRMEEENNELRAEEARLLNTNGELERRIKRLEEELMDTKNKHAVLVADVVLNEDRAERIQRLEDAGDALYANCDPSRWDSTATAARKLSDQNAWLEAKEAK